MKLFIVFYFLFIFSNLSAQKIDYNNFNNELASKVLFEELNKFRDTITVTGAGLPFEEVWPKVKKHPELRKLYWSDDVHNLISKPNITENIIKNRLHHVNRRDWWNIEKNREIFLKDMFLNYKSTTDDFLIYSENIGYSTETFETYQEMAKFMIESWDKSFMHRCLQRQGLYSNILIEEGKITKTLCATYVNFNDGTTWFVANYIHY